MDGTAGEARVEHEGDGVQRLSTSVCVGFFWGGREVEFKDPILLSSLVGPTQRPRDATDAVLTMQLLVCRLGVERQRVGCAMRGKAGIF